MKRKLPKRSDFADTSPEADLAREKAQLLEIIQHWSQAALARRVDPEAIRTVRIASELGAENWERIVQDVPFIQDVPLIAAAKFLPGSDMGRVALARYCLEHFSESGSDLWQKRRLKLTLLQTAALEEKRRRAEALEEAFEEAQAEDTRRDLEKARHAENRAMKETIVAWDREHGRTMSAEKAADLAHAEKREPVGRRTLRDWILAGRRDDGFTLKGNPPTS